MIYTNGKWYLFFAALYLLLVGASEPGKQKTLNIMYYKEEIIEGVLCYKHSPNGEWIKFSAQELTKRIIQLSEKVEDLNRQLESQIQGD